MAMLIDGNCRCGCLPPPLMLFFLCVVFFSRTISLTLRSTINDSWQYPVFQVQDRQNAILRLARWVEFVVLMGSVVISNRFDNIHVSQSMLLLRIASSHLMSSRMTLNLNFAVSEGNSGKTNGQNRTQIEKCQRKVKQDNGSKWRASLQRVDICRIEWEKCASQSGRNEGKRLG